MPLESKCSLYVLGGRKSTKFWSRLVYERMLARLDALYGQGIGSNYQAQSRKRSKHFRT